MPFRTGQQIDDARQALNKVLAYYGRPCDAARAAGVFATHVTVWKKRGFVSKSAAIKFAAKPELELTLQQLRPDLTWTNSAG